MLLIVQLGGMDGYRASHMRLSFVFLLYYFICVGAFQPLDKYKKNVTIMRVVLSCFFEIKYNR